MANVYTALSASDTCFAGLKTALQSKYGSVNVTVHYETTGALIFSCAAISNKVIKLIKATTTAGTVAAYYGDAWTSGTTITNQVSILAAPSNSYLSTIDLVLGDNFMLIVCVSTNASYNHMIIFGKLTNDSFVALGYGSNATGSPGVCYLTTGVTVEMIPFQRGFNDASSKLYKQPVMFVASTGILLVNGDGTAASFSGLYNVSQMLGTGGRLVGSNSFITPSTYTVPSLNTSLLAEW
jgi:hypothetical protein